VEKGRGVGKGVGKGRGEGERGRGVRKEERREKKRGNYFMAGERATTSQLFFQLAEYAYVGGIQLAN